jgi:hypothetical protein
LSENISDAERAAIVADAYDRRIAALHDAVTAWAHRRRVAVQHTTEGRFHMNLIRGERLVSVELYPAAEGGGRFEKPAVVIEDDATGMRLEQADGMPTAAAIKGLLTGLLFPEEMA